MKSTHTPTMKDVAARAGVSLGTVSKVINHIPVGEKNREKVNLAIKELGYKVNTYARGLKTQETKMIALIVPDTTNPFYARFTQYVEKKLYEKGYKLILCCANGIPEKEIGYLNLASQNKADGIIALTYTDVSSFIPAQIPIVSFDRYFENHPVPLVASDNFQGGFQGTKKLWELGCRRPVFIRFRSKFSSETDKRLEGYLAACKELNLPSDCLDLTDPPDIDASLKAYLEDHKDSRGKLTLDGIFANTDHQAYHAMKILNQMGYRIPEDVQILGFDGIRKYGIDDSALYVSSMCQPVEDLAYLCVEILLKKKEGGVVPSLSLLPVTYEYGGTTRQSNTPMQAYGASSEQQCKHRGI